MFTTQHVLHMVLRKGGMSLPAYLEHRVLGYPTSTLPYPGLPGPMCCMHKRVVVWWDVQVASMRPPGPVVTPQLPREVEAAAAAAGPPRGFLVYQRPVTWMRLAPSPP